MVVENLLGNRYGKLVVIERAENEVSRKVRLGRDGE